MRIYCCRFQDAYSGELLSWHPNKRDAEKALRDMRAERGGGVGLEEVKPIDIPTDKAGLLRWLNSHFDTDNG